MTRAAPSVMTIPGASTLAEKLDELVGGLQEAMGSPDPAGRLGPLRAALQSLQNVAETAGMDLEARLLGRLSVLTEVWECLSGEQADDVGFFCVKTMARFAQSERGGAGSDELIEWALEHSSSTWGEYLSLLEPPAPDAEAELTPEASSETPGGEAPALDAQSLLRLFTGGAGNITAQGQPSVHPVPPPVVPPVTPATDRTRAALAVNASEPAPPAVRERRPEAVPLELRIPRLPSRIDLDDEIREAFLADATDLFERIEVLVLGLHGSADPSAALAELGRCFHTLKGAAGSVGLGELASLVHALEEHLGAAVGQAPSGLIDVLHGTLGYLEGVLAILRTGAAPAGTESAASESCEVPSWGAGPAATILEPEGAAAPDEAKLQEGAAPRDHPTRQDPAGDVPPAGGSPSGDGPIRVPAARFDDLMDTVSELIARRRLWTAQAEVMKKFATMVRSCRGRMLGTIDQLHDAGLGRGDRSSARHHRFDVPAQLRRLGELADDLSVLAETAQASALPLADHGDALGRLTIQLWDELQTIRIVPIRGLFQRLARVAHDAARIEGRQVGVVMSGEETGLDRAVQDKAFEPLLHVVRNAVGHGIEGPSERIKAGKPAAGRIALESRREGNTLVIAVQDDGRGLNHEAIAEKARKLGLIAAGEKPSIERLNSLIFHSGFSTKSQANAISGRGVGMDVVAREVELLKGTVELCTEPGRGTRLTIRLPARLALEATMIVRVDGQALALPIAQIEHAQAYEAPPGTRPGGNEGSAEEASGTFVTYHDRQLPVVFAREILGLGSTPAPAWPKLLVVRSGGQSVGLVVDAIEGTEELVIKSLGSLLAGHPVISGTSCSASGEVISILNLAGLHRWVSGGLGPELSGPSRAGGDPSPARDATILVVDDSISVRRVVARHLRNMGLEVEEVSDGLEALGRLRSQTFALVVTDLEMPRLDGFELLAEMKRIGPLAAIPVIVASTRVDEETRRRVFALGATAFLEKPVDPSALATAVGPLLPRSES